MQWGINQLPKLPELPKSPQLTAQEADMRHLRLVVNQTA